jgi:hypothetical protein
MPRHALHQVVRREAGQDRLQQRTRKARGRSSLEPVAALWLRPRAATGS